MNARDGVMLHGLTPHRPLELLFAVVTLAGALILSACGGGAEARAREVPGGDPQQGAALIAQYGCGACHTIPGIRGANATVGPPLTNWARREFIGGQVPNQPEWLIAWIMNPQAIEPGTAMPNLAVTEPEARDIAAYLYTLD